MRFFSNLFPSKPPSVFTRNETFEEHKGLLRGFGTMRLTGDLQEISKKFFHLCFFKGFRSRKMGFSLFPVGENGFRVVCVLLGCFLAL